ncbi:alpha/beta fold hydrolase [Prosthecochloris sp. HL-130-GSB]|uniref:alpha/beta fold hydrolase n=1 Tax=Prosthecochloris sp. HL-130-GSB TaxID=1974213 RepID=UPI000A1C1478|nr:alpha/beta hydrolase [Prosthecochloris sp. HL-130-GSB]ARM31126.1 alpha/beta hydrolase [Prosthecochloris sp. HL-130-GSB]
MSRHDKEVVTEKFARYRQQRQSELSGPGRAGRQRASGEISLMQQSRFICLNGLLHHYHDSGPGSTGKTVLLIHGWDCWWMWWHHIIRELNANGYRTIAIDLRGHGWSDNDPDGRYCRDAFVSDLLALIDALGLQRFHIAAFSYGPVLALKAAEHYGKRVESMVFFNFGYMHSDPVIERVAPAIITFTFNGLLRRVGWWLPVYMFSRLVLSRNTVLKPDIQIGFASLGLCDPLAIEQTTREITSTYLTRQIHELVASLDQPALFVAGEGDPVMTPDNTEKLASMSPHGRFVCVPDCGHLITLELPLTASELMLDHFSAFERRMVSAS